MVDETAINLLRRLHQVANEVAGLLTRWGPQSEHLAGAQALALLCSTCTDLRAHQEWPRDVRIRLIIDSMISGLGRGFYRQGLEDLPVPHPQWGPGAPTGTAQRWAALLAELKQLQTALRPEIRGDDVEVLALRCPGMLVVSSTDRYVGGAGGSQICAQRRLHAITPDQQVARDLAQRLQRDVRPPLNQRALLSEVLEEGDGALDRLAAYVAALAWPRDGSWIGLVAFDDWCRAAGVGPVQAALAIRVAIGCALTANEGATFAEIRTGGTCDNENYGWELQFDRAHGFAWEMTSWQD